MGKETLNLRKTAGVYKVLCPFYPTTVREQKVRVRGENSSQSTTTIVLWKAIFFVTHKKSAMECKQGGSG